MEYAVREKNHSDISSCLILSNVVPCFTVSILKFQRHINGEVYRYSYKEKNILHIFSNLKETNRRIQL